MLKASAAASSAVVAPPRQRVIRVGASSLRLSRNAEPVPIPAAQGPVVAFYPAPEHAADNFKSAEDTKAALMKTINPCTMKIGNPLVSPRVGYIDGEGDMDIHPALFELHLAAFPTLQDLRPKGVASVAAPTAPLRAIVQTPQTQSKVAFEKRGRGSTTVVLECSPQLREALLNRSKVYIVYISVTCCWQVIEMCDFISVTCCRKCHQYGHPEKYCRSSEVYCERCGASGHGKERCKSEAQCCGTCRRFGRGDAATVASCPVRQRAERRELTNTNYGI